MNQRTISSICILLLFLLSGCAGVTFNASKAYENRRAAIVAFDANGRVTMRASNSVGSRISAIRGTVDHMNGNADERATEWAEDAYKTLSSKMNQETSWSLLPLADTISNSQYRSLYDRVSAKTASRASGAKDVPGLMWASQHSLITKADRDALFDALQVDVLLFVEATFSTGKESGSRFGFGTRTYYPRAALKVVAYGRGEAEPIWHDRYALGDPATTFGISQKSGVESLSEQNQAYREAFEKGLARLFERMREAKSESK